MVLHFHQSSLKVSSPTMLPSTRIFNPIAQILNLSTTQSNLKGCVPSDFIAKNQLAREGSQSVSPVTIPALTTIVDREFKEDRTLCLVWALRYYLDRTKDLRGSRSLLFISFKKGHTSDIKPATLSSWLKQNILLGYKQADQQALDLVQVKAHDSRAFTASKASYGWVSWTKSCKCVTGKLTTHLQVFT